MMTVNIAQENFQPLEHRVWPKLEKAIAIVWIATTTLLCACSAKSDRVILLPDASGKTGAIAILNDDAKQTVLRKAFEEASTDDTGSVVSEVLSRKDVESKYEDELASLPKRPVTFSIYFKFDSDRVSAGSIQTIEQIAEESRSRAAPELDIIGHTDTQGENRYNDSLSLRRAIAVSEMLHKTDLGSGSINIEGLGEKVQAVDTPDETSEPKNRRVEVTVR